MSIYPENSKTGESQEVWVPGLAGWYEVIAIRKNWERVWSCQAREQNKQRGPVSRLVDSGRITPLVVMWDEAIRDNAEFDRAYPQVPDHLRSAKISAAIMEVSGVNRTFATESELALEMLNRSRQLEMTYFEIVGHALDILDGRASDISLTA